MTELFIQAFVGSMLGGYGGYRYAVRNTPNSGRPGGLWQLSTSSIAGTGGAFLAVLFDAALAMAFSGVNIVKLPFSPLILGFFIGLVITQKYLKKP